MRGQDTAWIVARGPAIGGTKRFSPITSNEIVAVTVKTLATFRKSRTNADPSTDIFQTDRCDVRFDLKPNRCQ